MISFENHQFPLFSYVNLIEWSNSVEFGYPFVAGSSVSGNDIWCFLIGEDYGGDNDFVKLAPATIVSSSENDDSDNDTKYLFPKEKETDKYVQKTLILLDGGIHPVEVMGIQIPIQLGLFIKNCSEDFIDNNIEFMLILCNHLQKTIDLLIIPILNIDTHMLIEENGGVDAPLGVSGRKNQRENDVECNKSISNGIDLNRNFPFHFHKSRLPCDEIEEAGKTALSEPESRVIERIARTYELQTAIHFHSYGDMWIIPYNCCKHLRLKSDEDSKKYDMLKEHVANETHTVGNAPNVLQYTANGELTDYLYQEFGILNISVELGTEDDGFYPDNERM